MKKVLLITIISCIVLVLLKYFLSPYEIHYNVNNYEVITKYKNNRFYYEIKKDKVYYNFDIYSKRGLSKKRINNIKTITGDTFNCIYPVVDDLKTYPLCYVNGEYTDYNLIDSDLLLEYKKENVNVEKSNKDFVYYNNLSKDDYIALWNYKGYIIMNGNSYNNVELFKKDRYDNNLSYLVDDTLYIANYDEDHEYTKLITLNVKSLKVDSIKLNYYIDYDSYIVGNIDTKLYIFDNKYSVLYEINTKNSKVKIVANNEMGYVKYDGKDFVSCSKSEYKVNKIKINNRNNSIYKYIIENGLYKTINENNNIVQKINNNNAIIVKEKLNNVYYSFEDNFYIYNPQSGNTKIFYNYELSFNNNNTIFVYLNN